MNNERKIAIHGLMKITKEKLYSNIAINRVLGQHQNLEPMQKAFITDTLNGCLRNLLFIDNILKKCLTKPLNKLTPFILANLRVAVYQIYFMDRVPAFAICNEAVNLTKKEGLANLSSFVNGVLRNILRNQEGFADLSYITSDVDRLSIQYSYTPWIITHFLNELGVDSTIKLLETNAKPPKVSIYTNTNKINKTNLMAILNNEGVVVQESDFMPNSLKISNTGDITQLSSFKSGLYHIIDESSVYAISRLQPKKGDRVLDLCAAPGGKSFLMAYLMNNEGEIIASDIHEHKIKLLKDGISRLGLSIIKPQLANALEYNPTYEGVFDIVILDAPCSGLGIIRKKPDIKLFKEDNIKELAQLQKDMLKVAYKYLKPSGKLLYSTCTISKSENEDNIDWATKNLPLQLLEHNQILPQHYGTDGFFVSILQRNS